MKKIYNILLMVCVAVLCFGIGISAVAADNTMNLGEVTVYKLYGPSLGPLNLAENRDWSSLSGETVAFLQDSPSGKWYISGTDITPGVYSRSVGDTRYSIEVRYPTATVSGVQYLVRNGVISTPIGQAVGNTVETDKGISFTSTASLLSFTNPDGSLTAFALEPFGAERDAGGTYGQYAYSDISALDAGVWMVRAVFKKGGEYAALAPDYMYGNPYFFLIKPRSTAMSLSYSVISTPVPVKTTLIPTQESVSSTEIPEPIVSDEPEVSEPVQSVKTSDTESTSATPIPFAGFVIGLGAAAVFVRCRK